MSDPEDRILDLALEELHGSRDEHRASARLQAVLQSLERKMPLQDPPRRSSSVLMKAAAVAASILSLSLASWFVLGRFGAEQGVRPEGGQALPSRGRVQEDAETELLKLFERLTDSDPAERDRASAALREKGPALLDRLREEVGRAKDPEARARLQELISYWTHGVAARVDDYVVKWDEVDAAFQGMKPSDITPELRRSALRGVVEERAFLNEARRRGILVTEAELAELSRRKAVGYGGAEAYGAALRLRGTTPEAEREALRRELIISKLYDRILREARMNPGADPYRLNLKETPREELRRWYDANPDKFAAVDRIDVCWVQLRFSNEQEKGARKALADVILAKAQTKKNLGLACVEAGYRENIHIEAFHRGRQSPGTLSEATKQLLFDRFAFGEVRAVEDGSSIFVIQLYDRTRELSETFEEAEPAIRAMFENQRLEANRKLMRDGILERAQITPSNLFKDP